MPTTTKYLSALVAGSSPTFGEFMAAATAGDGGAPVIERMKRALSRGHAKNVNFISRIRTKTRSLEKAINLDQKPDIDTLIEALLQIERRSADEWKNGRRLIRGFAKILRRNYPEIGRQAAPLFNRYDENCADYLELLRDIRWDLMALEAEANPNKTSIPLDNPKEVRKHFASIRA